MNNPIPSAACDLVMAAPHPTPEDGGPCKTCAFRVGTYPHQQKLTVTLARSCVEGLRQFHCHEKPGLCKGYIAAANLRGTEFTEESEAYGVIADFLGDCQTTAAALQDGDTDIRWPTVERCFTAETMAKLVAICVYLRLKP